MLFPAILSLNGQMTLEGSPTPHSLSTPAARMSRCIFGKNLMIVAQIHNSIIITNYCSDKKSQLNGQIDRESQGQWP